MVKNRHPQRDGFAYTRARRHWNTFSAHWNNVASPLRPVREDLAVMEEAVRRRYTDVSGGKLSTLLLGVTREITEMQWPRGSRLLAVERAEAMIAAAWPGDIPGVRQAVRGDWLNLTDRDNEFDVVIGDGSFNCFAYPQAFRDMILLVHRMLKQRGILVMRTFTLPADQETPEQVLDDLQAGRIKSFHVFKFRLVMAMQKELNEGVRLGDVWQYWQDRGLDNARLARDYGWKREVVDTVNVYKDQDARLSFPRLEQIHEHVTDCFEQIALSRPEYEMGERCPTIVFRRLD